MPLHRPLAALAFATVLPLAAHAGTVVPLTFAVASGQGDSVGEVVVTETSYGLVFTPNLKGLKPGLHGFHVHTNGDCGPADKDGKVVPGGAAGGHYDPKSAGKHGFPWGDGHLGDLPALYVDEQGTATTPVLAPRLKMSDLKGRALMVHAGGDNYSDTPAALGGGGARMACGVVPAL